MNKSALFAFVKSDSIDDLIKASEVKTREDIVRLQSKDYSIGFTFDELKKVFPKKITDNLFYNNGFDKTFYYDKEQFVLFPVPIYGTAMIESYNEIAEMVLRKAEILEKGIETGDYFPTLLVLGDKMRMQMLNKLIEQDKSSEPYSLFASVYNTSDYGCSELSKTSIKKLAMCKTAKQKAETEKLLSGFPDKVTVYRGEGDRSAKWQDSVSWTTNINTANFFAARLPSNNAVIHIAQADKKDIIEYFEGENECIILPENIRLTESIEIKGLDFLGEYIPKVSGEYMEYRNRMLDDLKFEIDDDEHGRLHTLRVLLNALLIAKQRGLTDADTDKLCTAAIFHDVGRTNNGVDDQHGRQSAEYYRDFARHYGGYDKTVDNLIIYHCLPDYVGKKAMPKSDWEMYDILKDADALDRVRFGIEALDINQLRTPEAKTMTMIAEQIIQGVKLPEPELEQETSQGMEMQ